jgi:hypothetical protein
MLVVLFALMVAALTVTLIRERSPPEPRRFACPVERVTYAYANVGARPVLGTGDVLTSV